MTTQSKSILVRLDNETKEKAERKALEYGLTINQAIKVFCSCLANNKPLPFEVKGKSDAE